MKYISSEEWYEIDKWLDISQGFYEAYYSFLNKGIEKHLLSLNEKDIEIVFSYGGSNNNEVKVRVYCPEIDREYKDCFWIEEELYLNSDRKTKTIIAEIYQMIYFGIYNLKDIDSTKNLLAVIENILKIQEDQAYVNWMDGLMSDSEECIIKLYGRRILVRSAVNDWNESCTDFYFTCLETGRSILVVDGNEVTTADAAEKVIYLAIEPECHKIEEVNSELEYERIKEIVVSAICAYPYPYPSTAKPAEKQIIMLHNRQIIIKFKNEAKVDAGTNKCSYYISASIECITTGRSQSCLITQFDENPTELIRKIQELAWI